MDQVTLDQWNKKEGPQLLRVSEVSKMITALLESADLKNIWITGEITNFKKHSRVTCIFHSLNRLVEKSLSSPAPSGEIQAGTSTSNQKMGWKCKHMGQYPIMNPVAGIRFRLAR